MSRFAALLSGMLLCALGLYGVPATAQRPIDSTNRPNPERSTPNDPKELQRRVDRLAAEGRLSEALDVGELLLRFLERRDGPDELVITWFQRLDGLAARDGQWNRVTQYRKSILQRTQSRFGPSHWQTRSARLNLQDAQQLASLPDEDRQQLERARRADRKANQLFAQGRYSDALAVAREVPEDIRGLLGGRHQEYPRSLNTLAKLYYSLARYDSAEQLYVEARDIEEQTLGRDHPSYARNLGNLATLYWSMGDFGRAEPLFVQSSRSFAEVLGKDHPLYASSLSNLALLYKSMADYSQAETLYLEARDISERTVGKQHSSYATSLGNLANLYRSMGDYARSEPLYVESRDIKAATLGTEHPSYATSLNNLASLYVLMGDHARAEPLFLQARSIRESTLGQEHPDYALSLNNLAELYWSLGNYSRAEPLFTQSKSIRESALGRQHPDFATSLHNLASLYWSLGEYARAEPLYIEAKSIRERVLGNRHPDYARTLNNLGRLYASIGQRSQAEPLLQEAGRIYQQTLGSEHPLYAANRHQLAALYESVGDFRRAAPLYEQAIEITLKNLERTAYILSEHQQMVMNQSVRYQLDSYVSCCLNGSLDKANAVARVVAWKGSILKRQHGLRKAASDPAIAEQFDKLQRVAQQLSAHTRATPKPTQLPFWKQRLTALTREKERLESTLMRSSAAFRDATQQVRFEEIRDTIPDDAVLIDYLEFGGASGREILASVIRRNEPPQMLGLGSAVRAGGAIDDWRKSYGMTPDSRLAGRHLREQIWDPLLPSIGDAALVLVSTDGVLGRFPLGALPGKQPDSYLIEDRRLALIPVPQLLPALVDNRSDGPLKREMLLIGDVDYDAAPEAAPSDDPPKRRPRVRPWQRGTSTRSSGQSWQPLAETRAEVEFIAGLYRRLFEPAPDAVLDLRRQNASETAFRKYAGHCRYLHLATHGFFAAPELKSSLSPELVSQRGYGFGVLTGQTREAIRGHNPGQLSGLVFAGANRSHSKDASADRAIDDGVMTSDEIAFLPLGGVRLVVLSACETGLGEVAGGEGLLGIQRGFQVAGARTTIATLWKVDDGTTRRLMQEFYTNYLDREMSILDALRSTQLWALDQRASTLRGALRKTKPARDDERSRERLSPQYWAPFILSGDWR